MPSLEPQVPKQFSYKVLDYFAGFLCTPNDIENIHWNALSPLSYCPTCKCNFEATNYFFNSNESINTTMSLKGKPNESGRIRMNHFERLSCLFIRDK